MWFGWHGEWLLHIAYNAQCFMLVLDCVVCQLHTVYCWKDQWLYIYSWCMWCYRQWQNQPNAATLFLSAGWFASTIGCKFGGPKVIGMNVYDSVAYTLQQKMCKAHKNMKANLPSILWNIVHVMVLHIANTVKVFLWSVGAFQLSAFSPPEPLELVSW